MVEHTYARPTGADAFTLGEARDERRRRIAIVLALIAASLVLAVEITAFVGLWIGYQAVL